MAKRKDKTPAATFGNIALQNYAAQRGYEIGQDTSLGETLKPAVNLLGEYAKNAEIERGKFLSSLPDDFKVELLPASGKESFTNFASDAKQKYSEAAGLAAKYSANPNSEQYRNAVKDMESIKGGLSNSFDSYTKLADLRQGYINNEKANNKPIAMDTKEDEIYTAITRGEYKNFENTADGLVYNYENPDGVVEQIPFNELPNTKFVDSEMSTNVITSVLENPYTAGAAGDNMENSLATANNEVQKLITTPEGYRQAVFNGFDGPKTKFIDYYVGEQFITDNDKTFLNGINDINADGKITKDDMQNGVWSFKEGAEGDAARIAFENKITDHKNNPNFDVKTQLSEFMNGIAKDKYLEGKANKLKNEEYNLPGFGEGVKHSQVQVLFDKLNNNEVIRDGAARGFTEYTPAPGKPGFYTVPVTNEDGSEGLSELMPRDMVEGFLGINAVRDDFNVDPVKAEETPVMLDLGANDLANKDKEKVDADNDSETTTGGETTIVNTEEPVVEVDGVTGETIKVDPPKEIEYEKDTEGTLFIPRAKYAKEGGFYLNQQKGEADYGKGYKFENGKYVHVETVKFNENGDIVSRTPVAEEGEFRGDVDYTNQTEEVPIPRSAEISSLRWELKQIRKTVPMRYPKRREDIAAQIKASDSYIKAIDDVYMNTGIINKEGVMKRGIPFISNPSFGGRGDLHVNYNSEKKRNKKLREEYKKLEPVGDKKPVKNDEVKSDENILQNIPSKTVKNVEDNLDPPIEAIKAGEVELKDTEGNVVVGSKEVNNAPREIMDIDGIDYSEETSKDVQSTKVYNLKPITQDQFVSTEGVKSKIDEVAAKHGFSADELIKLIKFETGGSFDPSQKSGASSAVGLIQFMPKTIKGLDKDLDSEKVAAMTILEQLELVDAYFASQPNSVKGSHPYLQVATPKAATIGPDEILYKKGSKQANANPSWQNENGDVTPNSILTGAGFDPMPSTQA